MKMQENQGFFKTGDVVIGSSDPGKSVYSATGARINPNGVAIYGNEEDLEEHQQDIVNLALRSGGKPLQITEAVGSGKRKSKKKPSGAQPSSSLSVYKSLQEQHMEYRPEFTPPVEIKLQTIQFENEFGRIKAKVEHVVDHEQAYLLIFSDDDSMVFEPKVGESLILHTPDKQQTAVYYPGVTFDSPDNSKKFMILFKLPEENQE